MKVAIIGAGASGLVAIKSCLDEGLQPVCFDIADDIGGLWNWTERPIESRSTVMKSTIINTSKETSFYSDFVVPPDFPNFMHNTKVLEYFRRYAKHFALAQHVRFRTEVLRVSQAENFKETGRWRLELKDLEAGSTRVEEFGGVIVCSGHHADKKMPRFEGQEEFEGKIIHTHDYADYRGYEDKRVVVVGIGNSGVDVTIELSKISKQVYLSTRRGAWILSRVSDDGLPFDVLLLTRFQHLMSRCLPESVTNYTMERWLERHLNHRLYGLRPAHRWSAQHPTVCDDLANRLVAGNVIVKPDVRRLHRKSVEFVDGSVAGDVDAVICATGYLFGFPFVDHEALQVKDNNVRLYKYVFPPDVRPTTISVIGCVQAIGGLMPISEMQSRLVARVLKGDVRLPSSDVMREDILKKRESMSKRYIESTRHTMQVDFVPYMDELAELVGCKPNIFRLFLTDPRLALSVLFGPCSPYQYRLMGHGKWPGARDAILTVMDRIRCPLKTRTIPKDNAHGNNALLTVFVAVVIFALLAIYLQS